MPTKFAQRSAALAIAAALALTGCGSQSGSTPTSEPSSQSEGPVSAGTLTVGARVDNNSFDPADLEIGNRVQYWQPVYDTLIRLDAEATPQPNLATEWQYNDDSTVLTLELRDDVTFTDGEPFNGDAVKANIEHIQAGTGQNRFMVAAIEEVVVNSDTQVELRLSEPVPALLSYLGWVAGAMASPAALEGGSIAEEPVGSGPYVYSASDSTPGTEYVYTRNADYWNLEEFPYEEYIVRPINDVTALVNALKTGQVNAASLTPAVADEVAASGATVTTNAVAWAGLLINDREGTMVPELADVRVRQAINLAFDREGLITAILNGYGTPTSQVFNVQSDAYVEELDTAYTFDVAAAQQLMDEAGVGPFTITLPQWDGPWTNLWPILADQLAQIDVTVEYVQIPADQAVAEALSGKYPVVYFPLASATAWQDIQTWVAPDAPWNTFGASDEELDALIEAAQFAPTEEQPAAFAAVGEWLVENAWFAPLYRQDNVFGTTPDTTVTMQAQNAVPSLWQYRPAGG
ncbi:ABC transporter substrate-binding protein [Agrococcus sediminis]|uniref:ABC transporter substrate-binding protein n=1 Tax=Agrococcus TaxID=46352 RepID=UPI00286013BB|nr:ABC transporter substrate-binding protein [Agrococcus sp. BE272]MDR7233638.1 peptide/nickel transport system substrate-binding protein [Agrococcus sp. BE272]